MRVLLVSHRFPPDVHAGVELYTAGVADALAAKGHDVHVLARRLEPGARRAGELVETRPGGVVVHRIVREEHGRHGSGRLDRRSHALSLRLLAEARPEVVHATHLMFHAPELVERAARAGAAVVLSLLDFFTVCPRAHLVKTDGEACDGPRGGDACAEGCFASRPPAERRSWRGRARRFARALGQAHRLHCPSRFVHDYFAPRVPDPRRLRTLALGVDAPPPPSAARAPPRAPNDALELAFVGAVVPHKGGDVLLDALALAGLPRVRLRILGQTPDAAYLEALRARGRAVPGLEVVFHPPFPPGALPRLLEGADAVVVPSRVAETFSLVTHEALALGIPVLASRLGALPEVVRDGVNGALFDPSRPPELAATLARLAREPARLRALAEGAAATAVPRLDAHVEALLTLYREVLAVPRPPTLRERLRGLAWRG